MHPDHCTFTFFISRPASENNTAGGSPVTSDRDDREDRVPSASVSADGMAVISFAEAEV
jgi:hypothetical protein